MSVNIDTENCESPSAASPISTSLRLKSTDSQPSLGSDLKDKSQIFESSRLFQEYPTCDVDALKLIQFLEREDYTVVVQKLLLNHPELQTEFVETCKPRIDLKAKIKINNGLLKLSKKFDSKHGDCFAKRPAIDEFFREINALRTTNRPVEALVKFGYAINGAIPEVKEGIYEDTDLMSNMLIYFNKEILDTASVLDLRPLTESDCAKISKAKNLIVETDDYFSKSGIGLFRPFRSGIDYLENLLKVNDEDESSTSKRLKHNFDNNIFASNPFSAPCEDENLGTTVLPPLRGESSSNVDSSSLNSSLKLPHINSLPQLPEEVSHLKRKELEELQRQQQQFYGYPPDNQFPSPFT